MYKDSLIIGIDPDIYESGVALVDCRNRRVTLSTLNLPKLLRYISSVSQVELPLTIVVEVDRYTTYNWHVRAKDDIAVAAKKGYNVGRNCQRAIDIIEILSDKGYNVIEQRPLLKGWKGKDGKISDDEVKRLDYLSIMPKKTNQEQRDALLLALAHSPIPLRLKRDAEM